MSKNILVINFGGLGDEILFFPTLKSIKETYPDCKITLAIEPRSKACKDLTSYIDEVICVDIKSKYKYVEIIKFLLKVWQSKFDVVFSSGSSILVSVLLALSLIKERYGFHSGLLSNILLTKTAKINKNQYAANMYHDLVKIVNPAARCTLPEINTLSSDFKVKSDKPVVLIHPGVSLMSVRKNIMKFWDEKRWAELIDKILYDNNHTVVLAGGPDDKETVEKITSFMSNDTEDFKNCYGKTKDISDLVSLISNAAVMVCADSAPLHMAVALDTPVVAIFGPTDDKILLPEKDNIIVAVNDECECRPCLWAKRQVSCDERNCLDIKVDNVFEQVQRLLPR
ncbi:MAG: glycosyltransferase family 9 protein [Candidatus Gastranaerophilales bacterium]|nr:glycosyltransferase family 9 protein [Candidatus Gastranaerophilales bacterium]